MGKLRWLMFVFLISIPFFWHKTCFAQDTQTVENSDQHVQDSPSTIDTPIDNPESKTQDDSAFVNKPSDEPPNQQNQDSSSAIATPSNEIPNQQTQNNSSDIDKPLVENSDQQNPDGSIANNTLSVENPNQQTLSASSSNALSSVENSDRQIQEAFRERLEWGRAGFEGLSVLINNFEKIDKNKDDYLDETELRCLNSKQIQTILNLSINGDRKISRDDIRNGIISLIKMNQERLITLAWDRLDFNRDGKITVDEVVKFTNGRVSEKAVADLFAICDTNGDKSIDMDERIKMEPFLKSRLLKFWIQKLRQNVMGIPLDPKAKMPEKKLFCILFAINPKDNKKVSRMEFRQFLEKLLGKETVEIMTRNSNQQKNLPLKAEIPVKEVQKEPLSSIQKNDPSMPPVLPKTRLNDLVSEGHLASETSAKSQPTKPKQPEKYLIPDNKILTPIDGKEDGLKVLDLLKDESKQEALW
ncbi:MAG: hypothetical protein HQM08_26295 [Candidatus Riflebacteria bacterium]|nr:hypothetical protein [Candidatus Riflebacteria bacterium]